MSEPGEMNDADETTETTDRYVIEIEEDFVRVTDTSPVFWPGSSMRKPDRIAEIFEGPDRLLLAAGRAAELNAGKPELPPPGDSRDPREFLTKTLPAYARVQRLASMLTEAADVERRAGELLLADEAILDRARSLRMRLEMALRDAQSAETAETVHRDTREALRPPLAASGRAPVSALSKPGPY